MSTGFHALFQYILHSPPSMSLVSTSTSLWVELTDQKTSVPVQVTDTIQPARPGASQIEPVHHVEKGAFSHEVSIVSLCVCFYLT